jgi:hypothetical protein
MCPSFGKNNYITQFERRCIIVKDNDLISLNKTKKMSKQEKLEVVLHNCRVVHKDIFGN